jgi:hypothetical protein
MVPPERAQISAVADFFNPVNILAVHSSLDGDMSHRHRVVARNRLHLRSKISSIGLRASIR